MASRLRIRRLVVARSASRRLMVAAILVATVAPLAGCGLDVNLGDVFELTRTGAGSHLTLVVNDSGSMSCNGGKMRQISSARLIAARDLSDDLTTDATKNLTIKPVAGSVYYYVIRMSQGTISFPDRAAAGHPSLAQAELFATQAAVGVCGLSG